MPVGAYSDVKVEPTCGLAGPTALIGLMDDPASFYEPDRLTAQLVWFRAGHVEYLFPNRVPPGSARSRRSRSPPRSAARRRCTTPTGRATFSLWVNGVHLGAWTCPRRLRGHARAVDTELVGRP